MFAVVAFCVMVVVVTALSVSMLRRRNRVSPRHRSPAPVHWLGSPLPSARLHRRLQRAVDALALERPRARRRRVSNEPVDALDAVTAQIERHAVGLDHQVVVATALRGEARRVRLRELSSEIEVLESATHRVMLARASRACDVTANGTGTLVEIHARLDALEAARAEIAAIEDAHGLRFASGARASAPSPSKVRTSESPSR